MSSLLSRPWFAPGLVMAIASCASMPVAVERGPNMVRVPAGRALVGSAPAETAAAGYPEEYARREQPAREVAIRRAFAISRTEVTRGAFARFVAATGWRPNGPCSYLPPARGAVWNTDTSHDWRNPGFPQDDDHPVVCVSLADATAYARWLSERTGRRFRLPSNVEWEYAARAGMAAPFPWKKEGIDACRYANLSDRTRANAHNGRVLDPEDYFDCDDGFVGTAPAASFRPNAWGLYDTLGNVWEWTLDCLHPNQVAAPSGPEPRPGGDCRSHIDRGASWVNSRRYVRFAAQHPDLVEARTSVLGFRLVEDLP